MPDVPDATEPAESDGLADPDAGTSRSEVAGKPRGKATTASPERAVLIGSGVPTALVGLLAVGVGAVISGWSGALGALLGTVIVLLFFGVGQVVVGRVLRTTPALGLSVALLTYLAQIGVLFLVLVLFRDTTAFDTEVFGVTIVATAVTWLLASVRAYTRPGILYVEPGRGPSDAK